MKTAQTPEPETRIDWEAMRQRIAEMGAVLAGADEISPEALQRIWAQRAAQLAQLPVQEDEGEQLDLVLVQLGREIYGLDVQYVTALQPVTHFTPVPRVPDWVAGVMNWRGRIFSVVDLQRFFNLAPARNDDPKETPYLVVVESPEMELALLVDDVLAVEALPVSQMQAAADTVRGLPPEYVCGVIEHQGLELPVFTNGNGSMLVVLDLPVLLADERLIIHEEIV
jgi:purine-binding chemotaxis protein CheW